MKSRLPKMKNSLGAGRQDRSSNTRRTYVKQTKTLGRRLRAPSIRADSSDEEKTPKHERAQNLCLVQFSREPKEPQQCMLG
jgi:hypothetical protein